MSAPLRIASAPVLHPADNVFQALAAWARRADPRLLAAWAVVGWLDAAGLAVFLPRLWLLALPLVSVSALGVWGLATQRLRALETAGAATPLKRQVLLAVRTAAVTIGTVAAIAAFYAAFLLAMGPRAGGPDG
jgi:hypothetical protein